jgi:hypothetical protein
MPSVDMLSPLISVSSSCVYKDSFPRLSFIIVTTSLHTLVIASFVTYRRIYFQQKEVADGDCKRRIKGKERIDIG